MTMENIFEHSYDITFQGDKSVNLVAQGVNALDAIDFIINKFDNNKLHNIKSILIVDKTFNQTVATVKLTDMIVFSCFGTKGLKIRFAQMFRRYQVNIELDRFDRSVELCA